MNWNRFTSLPSLTLVILIVLDQWTKYLVIKSPALMRGEHLEVIPNFFYFVHIRNTGAAWGFFADHTSILTLISIAVLSMLIVKFRYFTSDVTERCIAVSLMLGGIGGNLIDRVFRKGVVDFLSFSYKSFEWPAFNVADSAICVGVALYTISSLIQGDVDHHDSSVVAEPCKE